MVVNAPTSNIVSAAELAVALLLACARNIAPANHGAQGRPVEALEVHRRRAGRQDRRRRRPRPHRAPRRAAPLGVRREADRLRPLRPARPRRAARRPHGHPRRAARRVRLHHRPPAEDPGDRRPHRRGGAAQGQADRAHRQRRARRDRRRAGAVRRPQGGPRRRRRPRRVRQGAVHRLAALRVRDRRGHTAPRRVHGRGAGEGRHRRGPLGAPRARRRARAGRRQRPGRFDRRGRAPRHRRWPRSSAASPPRWPTAPLQAVEVEVLGEIAEHDVKILELSALKGVFSDARQRAGVLRQRAGPRRRARRRGVAHDRRRERELPQRWCASASP